jgi:O-methyltransferase
MTLQTVADADLLYLDLLKNVLTRHIQPERFRVISPAHGSWKQRAYTPLRKLLGRRGLEVVRRHHYDHRRARHIGWPPEALTMIGLNQLSHLQDCVADVLKNDVPGDFIETGVWRGGSCIFMRAMLRVYGDARRTVWVADSFRGLPPPDTEHFPADRDVNLHTYDELSVPVEQVKKNFAAFGLLDGQVRFLEGWFKDTLPSAPIDRLAILRIDGDLYQSTTEALESLYDRVSPGGYVIIDDYGAMKECRAAVDDFRMSRKITGELNRVDEVAWWQKSVSAVAAQHHAHGSQHD